MSTETTIFFIKENLPFGYKHLANLGLKIINMDPKYTTFCVLRNRAFTSCNLGKDIAQNPYSFKCKVKVPQDSLKGLKFSMSTPLAKKFLQYEI